MAIEGGGQPHVPLPTGNAQPVDAAAKSEKKEEAAAHSHAEQAAANVGPSTLAHIPEAAENRKETGPQNGGTPVSAGKTNEVAQSVFVRRPPPGPSPRSKQAVAHPQPQPAMEPIGGGAAPILEPIKAKIPNVPERRPGRTKASPEEIKAHQKYLATEKRKAPTPSPLQRGDQPAKLTAAYHSYKETKGKELAALNNLKAADSEKIKQKMQEKVDDLYPVIAQCIKERKVPILEKGVLKVGSSEKGPQQENNAYQHIADIFAEAYTTSRGLVTSTNEKDLRFLLSQLRDMGMPSEIFDKADQTLTVPKERLQEAARDKALEGVQRSAPLPPAMPLREIYERILMGDSQAADLMIFSHRESSLTSRPFAALQEMLQSLPRVNPKDAKQVAVRQAVCDNALNFAALYLETGASIPVDPAKKAALKADILNLLALVANNASPAAENEVKTAIANHLQAPTTGDVVWGLNQARSSLRTSADMERALNVLELTRGRTEPAIIDARNALRLDLLRLDNPYRFDQRSAKELTEDLGALVERTFRSMKPSELELRAFSDDRNKRTDAPAMNESVEQFNKISDFLKLQILENVSIQNGVEVRTAKSPKEAAKAMAKVIDIGYEAMQNGNYQLAFIAFSAVDKPSVSRLQQLLLKDDPRSRQKRDELATLCDPASDYKNYQTQLAKDRAADKHVVPFLVPMRKSAIMLKEAGSESNRQVDVGNMTRKADLKRQFSQDLSSLRERPLLQGHPAASVAIMRQFPVGDEVLDRYSEQLRPRPTVT